jgi:hypothetical protein
MPALLCAVLVCFITSAFAQTSRDIYQAAVLGSVTGNRPTAYFHLDAGNLTDSRNPTTSTRDLTATSGATAEDIFGNTAGAYRLTANTGKLVESVDVIAEGSSAQGSITLLFRTLGALTTSQRYLLSQNAVTSGSSRFALYFENDNTSSTFPQSLTLRIGDQNVKILDKEEIEDHYNQWYYLALTWNEARNDSVGPEVHWWIGPVGGSLVPGEKNLGDSAVVGNGGAVYIGNRDATASGAYRNSSTDEGILDEVAFWSRELDYEDDILTQFYALPNPPVLAPIGSKTVAEGATLTFIATATDPNLPSQSLAFSIDSDSMDPPPSWLSITEWGVVTATPTAAGSYHATIRVTDNGSPALSDSERICIIVNEEVRYAPSFNFDLKRWNLLLPVNSAGGFSADPALEIQTTGLQGFEYVDASDCTKKYFYTDADGAMVFTVPYNGSPGSPPSGSAPYDPAPWGKARSELRETTTTGADYNWKPGVPGVHILDGSCIVNVAGEGKVGIGQIHAKTPAAAAGPAVPAIILYYDGRDDAVNNPDGPSIKISVYDKTDGTDTTVSGAEASGDTATVAHYTILTDVAPNTLLNYQLKIVGDATSCKLYCTVNGEKPKHLISGDPLDYIDMYQKDPKWSKTAPDSPDSQGNPTDPKDDATRLYFKAGCYYPDWTGREDGDAGVTAQVTFKNLVVTHADPSLVSLWKGELNANDSVGKIHVNDGELIGGATYTKGLIGQGFQLDGVDGYIRVPDDDSLDIEDEMTVEMWFRRATSSTEGPLIDKRDWYGCNIGAIISLYWGFQLYYDDPWVFDTYSYEISFSGVPSAEVFHHFVGTYEQLDGEVRMKTYIDGQLVQTDTRGGDLMNTFTATALAIGAARDGAEGGGFFHGIIDEVALYNRVLTATEVADRFLAPAVLAPPPEELDTIRYWDLSRGDSGGDLHDVLTWWELGGDHPYIAVEFQRKNPGETEYTSIRTPTLPDQSYYDQYFYDLGALDVTGTVYYRARILSSRGAGPWVYNSIEAYGGQ